MMFEYMRQPTVWHAFCATYEGIYDKMIEFDTWYAKVSSISPRVGVDPLYIYANLTAFNRMRVLRHSVFTRSGRVTCE